MGFPSFLLLFKHRMYCKTTELIKYFHKTKKEGRKDIVLSHFVSRVNWPERYIHVIWIKHRIFLDYYLFLLTKHNAICEFGLLDIFKIFWKATVRKKTHQIFFTMKSEVESESKDMGIVLDSIVQEYRERKKERYKIKDKILRHRTTAAGISSTSMRRQKQPATDVCMYVLQWFSSSR